MQNIFKQFGVKATGSFNKRFHLSLLKLTAVYIIILAGILFLSSSITYSAFSSRLQRRFDPRPPIRMEMFEQAKLPKMEDVRADLIYSLIIVNGILLIAAGALSYLLARLTLEPIKHAFEKQRRFLSDASHELRTPLSVLSIDLENELADSSVTGRTRERAQSNLDEVKRMSRLINDLLIVSRDEESYHLNAQNKLSVNLVEVIKNSIDRLKLLADQHHISINFNPQEKEDIKIITNLDLLNQIFANVIKNAIVYNKPNGSVDIILEKIKNEVEIRIIDTGIGIIKEDLSKIFDRFYRGDLSRSRQTGGSGLGLSIVQTSIEQLGGSVEISSELNKGTTVVILLPVK